MTEIFIIGIIAGCVIVLAASIAHTINKVVHGSEIKVVCAVCRRIRWLPKVQAAQWVMSGMRGDGRCDCGSLMKSTYLAHPYIQGVISRAHSQLFRNDAAEETIKTIQENLERANRARIPEVVQ